MELKLNNEILHKYTVSSVMFYSQVTVLGRDIFKIFNITIMESTMDDRNKFGESYKIQINILSIKEIIYGRKHEIKYWLIFYDLLRLHNL